VPPEPLARLTLRESHHTMRQRWLLGLGALLVLAGVAAYSLTLVSVYLEADGSTRTVRTHARTVAVVLRDSGVQVGADDAVDPSQDTRVDPGMLIRVRRGRWIDVVTAETSNRVLARQNEVVIPANLFLQVGVHLLPGDAVWADGSPVDAHAHLERLPNRLALAEKYAVEVVRDGVGERHTAAGPTVGEALWQLGIDIHPGDSVVPSASTPLLEGAGLEPTRIVIRSAREFQIEIDSQTVVVRSAAQTVGEILAQGHVALTNLDYSRPADSEPAPANGLIRVVRVREDFIREQSPIAFGEQRQYLPEVDLGAQQLITPGVYGIKESIVRVRSEDGAETSRTSEGERVAVPPVDRVMGYGTKVTIRSASIAGDTFDYWHSITVYGSAYWPCGSAGEPGRCYYKTASGKDVDVGIIAVVLKWYRVMQGWPVYVERYGFAHIEDNGINVTPSYWIDVAFPDYETFVALGGSGPKTTTLYFRTPVPSEDAIRFVAALPLR